MELTSFYRSKPITPADAAGRIASGATLSKGMTIKFAGQDEEAALVLAAKSGDGRAFEILVERHRQRILAVVRRFTHIREDAEDIVQQSLQKAFFHLHRFQGKSRFSTWLTRIAINEALMFLRRGRGLRRFRSAIYVEMKEPHSGSKFSIHARTPRPPFRKASGAAFYRQP